MNLTAEHTCGNYPTSTTLTALEAMAKARGHRVVKATYGGGTQIEVRATSTRYTGEKVMRRVQCYAEVR